MVPLVHGSICVPHCISLYLYKVKFRTKPSYWFSKDLSRSLHVVKISIQKTFSGISYMQSGH